MSIINIIINLVKTTPIWVWFVLVYLLFIGIKSLKSRIIYLPKLFIIPVILITIKYKDFSLLSFNMWIIYSLGILITAYIGWQIAKQEVFEKTSRKLYIRIEGNCSTLVLLISFFIAKYIAGYLRATTQYYGYQLVILEVITSGLLSGYFLGKALNYLKNYLITTNK